MRKLVIVIGLVALLGCSSAYYGTMEASIKEADAFISSMAKE